MVASRRSARLLELAKEIIQLENSLALCRAEFERLAHGTEPTERHGSTDVEFGVPTRPALARTSSLPQRVQSVLDVSSGSLTAQDIAAQLGAPLDSVRAALSKLVVRESVERIGTGVYRSTAGGHRRAAGEDD